MRILVSHNIADAALRLGQLPATVLRHVDSALGRGAAEVSREARKRAPKNSSELVNRIAPRRGSLLLHLVESAAEHSSYLEEGTEPGGQPSGATVLEWMRRAGVRPRTPGMNQFRLARLIRRSIAKNGIEAQPFMQPAFDAKRSRLAELVRGGVNRGIAEADRA